MTTTKLYLITRADLPPGQQAVQAAHALRQFVEEHPTVDQQWFKSSNTLALLATADERALGVVYDKALVRGISAAAFHEPDRGGEMTAIALGPEGHSITRNLPLALSSRKADQHGEGPGLRPKDISGSRAVCPVL